jgi:hypothetical protein
VATATATARTDRLLLAAAVVTVLPLWSAKYLPFTDLPEHLAVIATLRHWVEWNAGATYAFASTKSQYLAYHLVGALLAFPFGSELANRLLLSAVGVALPYGMRALLRAYGTEERLAILACPLFWSRPLVLGLLPYVAALPVLLFALALFVRERAGPKPGRLVAIAALSVLTFYIHLAAYTALVAVAFALSLVPTASARFSLRPALRTALALLPSFACAALWAASADARGGPMLLVSSSAARWPTRSELGSLFAAWAHDIWCSPVDDIEGAVFWGIVLWLGTQRGASEPDGTRGVLARLVPFIAVLALFIGLPLRLGAGAMLNVRLAPLLAFFALPILRPDPGVRSRRAVLAGAALSLAVALTATVEIRRAQRELGDFDALLDRIRPGARVLTLHFDSYSKVVQAPPWIHLGSYHRVRHGGVASLSFSAMAHWPIRFRPEAEPPEAGRGFWDFKPCLFRNTIDGRYYDYVLSNGNVDPFANDPPGPSWRRVAATGPWRLDEKIEGSDRNIEGVRDVGPCSQ